MKFVFKAVTVLVLTGVCSFTLSGEEEAAGKEKAAHGVLREIWWNIPGQRVFDLVRHPAYRGAADRKDVIDQIDDSDLGELHGARYTTLLEVPVTGEYTFYISSDDGSEIWLSKDETQNDMSCIAGVKGFTLRHNWSNQLGQKSVPIKLEKGRKYFLCVLRKQEYTNDHVSVAWTGPGIEEPAVIPLDAFTLPAAPENKEK